MWPRKCDFCDTSIFLKNYLISLCKSHLLQTVMWLFLLINTHDKSTTLQTIGVPLDSRSSMVYLKYKYSWYVPKLRKTARSVKRWNIHFFCCMSKNLMSYSLISGLKIESKVKNSERLHKCLSRRLTVETGSAADATAAITRGRHIKACVS